jgi:large repetitive protein
MDDDIVWSGVLTTAGSKVARAAAVMLAALVVLAVGWAGTAVADEAPTLAIDQPLTGSFTNDRTPAFSGTTDDALDSIVLKIYEGPNTSGSPVQTSGEIAPDPIGPNEARWEIAPASPLEPGEYTAVAEQTNATPETGVSTPVTFTVDTTEPAVSIDAPASPTNDSTPTLTGAAGVEAGDEASVAVTIHEGGSLAGAVAASGSASLSGGGWSFTPGKLADGTYTAQAVQEDQAGNVGKSAAVTFTVDTKSPTVSINPVAAFTNDTTPTLTGAAGVSSGDLASVTVTIYEGATTAGQVLATKSVTPTGATWSFTAPQALAQGTYTAQAAQEDQAGNVGKSAAVTFTVDTSAPAVSINSVAAFTSNTTPALTGGAGVASGDVSSVTVTIFEGASTSGKVAVSEVVAAAGSSWSFTPGKALAQGIYTAQATQEDKAGNLAKSSPVTFTVDTTAPAVTINSLATPTKNATPTLSGGAGTASGDQASVTVTVYEGSSTSGKVVASETVTPAAAAWSWSLANKLLDGTYTAQATQKDQAGNLGKSAGMTFVLDTGAPTVSINALAAFTNDTTPTLTGAAGVATGDAAAVTVTIYEGSSTAGKIAVSESVVPAGSTWSFTPGKALAQGTYTAQATQEDKAGNLGKSAAVTFAVDTSAPAVSISQLATLTKNATPTLSGAAGVATGDQASVQVTIYEGGAVGGTVVQFTTATRSGPSWSWLAAKLADGTYTAQAVQEDQAGNLGKSTAMTFTVDTSAPAVSLNAPAQFTSDTTPMFSGGAGTASGDLASVTVTVYEGASTSGKVATSEVVMPSGASWSYTPAKALAQGTYTVQATQEDKAGNIGKSAAATLAIDTTAPIVSINPVSTPTKNALPSFAGTAGELSGDQASVTVTLFKGVPEEEHVAQSVGVSVSAGGWSYSASPALSDGPYTVQVSQRDAAGNVATRQVAFTIDTVAPVVAIDSVPTPSKNQTPKLLGGAGIASGDHTTVTVNVYKGEAAAGTPMESVPVTVAAGAWSHSTPTLADGTYTAQAVQEDSAGNVGKSTAVTFTVDTTAPTVSVTPVTSPTKNQTPTISGVAGVVSGDQASVTVTVYEGVTASGKVAASETVATSGASWSFTPGKALAQGTYTVQATQEDKAGNIGKSAAVTFAVDTTAPVITVTTPTNNETFHLAQPRFSGEAGHASGDDNAITVNVYEGETATGIPTKTLHTTAEGSQWAATVASELPNGPYTVQAEQSDAAGNVGKSKAVKFAVKTELTLIGTFGVEPGTVRITGPAPIFNGAAASSSEGSLPVVVNIYSGTSASGEPRVVKVLPSGSRWTASPITPLSDGEYTVQAEQGEEVSEAFTFTVDADAPNVTLTSPASGSATSATAETVAGALGTASGDKQEATVKLYAGSGPGGAVVQSRTVAGSGGSWSASFEGLAPGAYTAQAEQRDEVENVGLSESVTFTVVATVVLAPQATPSVPAASFRWVPAAPHPGEPVTLISTSTDSGSSIAGFAWAPAGNEAFAPGESTLTTTFAVAGAHVVQLRVMDANGQSSTVAETIPVTAAAPTLMQPFPVVRIAGSFTSSGAKISLLTVLAPVGATVKVTCHGGGCATKSQHMVIASGAKSKAGTVLVNFRRFERTLHAGAVLDVWVSNHGQIGKFTRFLIRRGKTPTRTDTCLDSAGTKPIVCPS